MAKKPAIGIRKKGAPPKPISRRKPLKRQPKTALTHKQQMFIERYVLTLNATRAYQEAYPDASWATADATGSKLMKDSRIVSEIKLRLAPLLERYRPDAANVLKTLADTAFSDIRDVVDENDQLRRMHDLPVSVTRAIRKIKIRKETSQRKGEDVEQSQSSVIEVEMKDTFGPLRLLGVQEGLFGEKVDVNLGSGFAEALRELREREARVE